MLRDGEVATAYHLLEKLKLVCPLLLYRQQPQPDVGKQGGLWREAVTIWVLIGSTWHLLAWTVHLCGNHLEQCGAQSV